MNKIYISAFSFLSLSLFAATDLYAAKITKNDFKTRLNNSANNRVGPGVSQFFFQSFIDMEYGAYEGSYQINEALPAAQRKPFDNDLYIRKLATHYGKLKTEVVQDLMDQACTFDKATRNEINLFYLKKTVRFRQLEFLKTKENLASNQEATRKNAYPLAFQASKDQLKNETPLNSCPGEGNDDPDPTPSPTATPTPPPTQIPPETPAHRGEVIIQMQEKNRVGAYNWGNYYSQSGGGNWSSPVTVATCANGSLNWIGPFPRSGVNELHRKYQVIVKNGGKLKWRYKKADKHGTDVCTESESTGRNQCFVPSNITYLESTIECTERKQANITHNGIVKTSCNQNCDFEPFLQNVRNRGRCFGVITPDQLTAAVSSGSRPTPYSYVFDINTARTMNEKSFVRLTFTYPVSFDNKEETLASDLGKTERKEINFSQGSKDFEILETVCQ